MKTARILFNGLPIATATVEAEGDIIALSGYTVTDRDAFERIRGLEQCTVLCADRTYMNCTLIHCNEAEGALTLMPDVE